VIEEGDFHSTKPLSCPSHFKEGRPSLRWEWSASQRVCGCVTVWQSGRTRVSPYRSVNIAQCN